MHTLIEVTPRVSVVIATKDRPELLMRVLASVRRQTMPDFEVLVVDDGSSQEVVEAYSSIWMGLDERFRLHLNPPGGGPGGARNAGIRLARSEFVAFCDDDDTWVRDDHLETALQALVKFRADAFIGNMQTSFNGTVIASDWYGKFGQWLSRSTLNLEHNIFDVRKRDLACFLQFRPIHTDTLVVRRQLLVEMGLYWDRILIGEDVNLSFRLADAASRILYCPLVAAEGDGSPHTSITRRTSREESAFSHVSGLLHAQFSVHDSRLRHISRRRRAATMVQLSVLLLADGKKRSAFEFAAESLAISLRPAGLRQLIKCLFSMAFK